MLFKNILCKCMKQIKIMIKYLIILDNYTRNGLWIEVNNYLLLLQGR